MPNIKTPQACKMIEGGITSSEDVLFIYVGQKATVITENDKVTGKIMHVIGNDFYIHNGRTEEEFWGEFPLDKVRIMIHLKHCQDMQPNEKKEYKRLCHKITHIKAGQCVYADTPQSILYGIKLGYDMFDLIDTGQAIIIEQ